MNRQIISFSEKHLDIQAIKAVREETAEQDFLNFVSERAQRLLGVSKKEAVRLMDTDSEEVHYCIHQDGSANASIRYGEGYDEYIAMTAIPDVPKADIPEGYGCVSLAVTGRYYAFVPDENYEEMKKNAIFEYENADFGELECVDVKVDHIEDANGNYLYED